MIEKAFLCVLLISFLALGNITEMFPASCKEGFSVATWRNCSLVLQKKRDVRQMAEMSPVLPRKCVLEYMARKLSSCYTRYVNWPHGINVHLVLGKKYDFTNIAEIFYNWLQRSQYILHIAGI